MSCYKSIVYLLVNGLTFIFLTKTKLFYITSIPFINKISSRFLFQNIILEEIDTEICYLIS